MLKKQINNNLELKKCLKEKVINYMSNGKVMIIRLIVGLIKKTLYKTSKYFPKPFNRDINVKVFLSDYATKTELKNINLSFFNEKSYFDEDGAQNYLVFQSMLEYFTLDDKWITKRKSKGLSNKNLEVVSTSDNTLSPESNYYENKLRLNFKGCILQQKIVTYSRKKVVSIFIVFEITKYR